MRMKVPIVLLWAFSLLVLASDAADQYSAECRVAKDKTDSNGANSEQPMAKYDFQWAVRDVESQVDMGQQERRKGDDTNGNYQVVLPNGGRQIVNYQVNGPSGYRAHIRYEKDENYVVGRKPESRVQESRKESQQHQEEEEKAADFRQPGPKRVAESTRSKEFTRGTEYKIVDYKTAGSSALYRRFTK